MRGEEDMASHSQPSSHRDPCPMRPEGQGDLEGWRPTKTAPEDVPVIVLTEGGQIFKARLTYGYANDDSESGLCWGWSVEDFDVRPDCWSDGVCWRSNDEEEPSDKPVAWMPIPDVTHLSGPQRSEAALSATDEPLLLPSQNKDADHG